MKFKKGQRVAAYIANHPGGRNPYGIRVTGTIEQVELGVVMICGTWFHEKQCRKINKKRPTDEYEFYNPDINKKEEWDEDDKIIAMRHAKILHLLGIKGPVIPKKK